MWYFVHFESVYYPVMRNHIMSFCSQSRPLQDFSVFFLLCLWILCSILSVRQGTICGLLASSTFFPYFCCWCFPHHCLASYGPVIVWSGSFFRSFCVNVVLPLVIHSGTCAVFRHLFISRASVSWMEVNFFNQKPCIPSWPGVFQFDTFLSVVLNKSVCISAFELFFEFF